MRNLPLNYEQVERLLLQKQDHRRVLAMLRDDLYCCHFYLVLSIPLYHDFDKKLAFNFWLNNY